MVTGRSTLDDALDMLLAKPMPVFLGGRYGLTPHHRIPAALAEGVFGAPQRETVLCEAMRIAARRWGRAEACDRLSTHAGELDQAASRAIAELADLRPLTAGRPFLTSSYMLSIPMTLHPQSAIVRDDNQVHRVKPGQGALPFVVMLHGAFDNLDRALLTEEEVNDAGNRNPKLRMMVELIARESFLVLGANSELDRGFVDLCWTSASNSTTPPAIWVVDPRDPEDVAAEWPRAALRHLRMEPADFFAALRARLAQTASANSAPKASPPGPGDYRTVRIFTADGRALHTDVRGTTRVGDLARQVAHELWPDADLNDRRAVVDLIRPGDSRLRLVNEHTLHEAQVGEAAQLHVHLDHVAGCADPSPRDPQTPPPPDTPTDDPPPAPQDDGDGALKADGGPPGPLGPGDRRTVRMYTIDNRALDADVRGTTRVGDLARQFARELWPDADLNDRRAVVDLIRPDGSRQRLNSEHTLHEAQVGEADQLQVHLDHVAGMIDPRRRHEALIHAREQVQRLVQQDERVEMDPLLPGDLPTWYTLRLSCPGWAPPPPDSLRPVPIDRHEVQITLDDNFPDVAPKVAWLTEVYHPNIRQQKPRIVCLGDLEKHYIATGLDLLVRTLIDMVGYRNYELAHTVNPDAGIWAQFNVDQIVARGGWPYQPRVLDIAESGDTIEFAEVRPTFGPRKRRSG